MFKLQTNHFLTGEELSKQELLDLLDLATLVKTEKRQALLKDKTIGLVFDKPSLRTRVSFTVAIQELNGQVVELTSAQRKKEDPADTIRVLQGYLQGVMVRTFEHSNLDKMAAYSKIPIINGLSDLHHPCQVLADLQTLKERFGNLQGLTLAYIGDGNNMLHSLLLLLPFVGVNVHYACPEGYKPNPEILSTAKKRAEIGAAKIVEFNSPLEAVTGVNAIYTDVWTSMGFESEEKLRLSHFDGYQVNSTLYKHADKDAVIMHCMPVNKDQEITEEMIEHSNSVLFEQSENRLHAQKALMIGLFSKLV